METILIYLAKSSAILGIFYIIYVLFLNNETFFEMNRFYLISGIFAAFTIPFITITKTVYIEPVTTTIPSEMLAAEFLSGVTATPVEPEFTINWIYVFGVLYVLGMAIMFAKLIGQLVSVYRIISNNEISEENGIKFVKTNKDHTPFSFFSYVVYNPELFSKEELDIILTHEKAHSKERHSVDILISKMTNILQWLNPFAWLYQRSITQNLEYLADKKATNDLDCRKTYQLTLLKATKLNHLSITNNFFNSLIKKRIIMLQQQKSKKRNMFKLAIVVPVLIAFVYVFNTEVRAQVKQTVSNVSATLPAVDEELRKDKVIKIKIDKNTSKVDLEKMKKSLKKEGIDFKYRKLKFNKSNELTSISVSVKDKNGNSESYAMSSDKGIDPFYFHTSGDDMSFYGGGSYDKGDYVFVTKDGASIHEIKMREHKEKMRKHKEKMKAHKIKIKAHTDLGGDHEDVWVSEDGKTIKINKSKVIVIGDGDGEH
ncbi:MAG: M56 family metallopeptidase [Flavobacteriaceae bacterium]|nr:M56 family metallopeptidase [Flavobacteriaceae bacterium]